METSGAKINAGETRSGKFVIENDFIDRYACLCGWKATQVYFALCRYANKERCCFPSIERLSKKLGIAESSVKRGIRELLKLGIIRVEKNKWKNGTWKNNFYCLLDRSKWKTIPETPEAKTPESLGENHHSSGVTHHNQSSVETHQNIGQNQNHRSAVPYPETPQTLDHRSVETLPQFPQTPDHRSVVPTKDTHTEGYPYKKETHNEGIKDTLILQRIEIIKRYGFKDIDTRIIPYTQDGAHNFSTPSEIMKIFIKSFKAKDAKYLNLLEQLKGKGIPAEIAETELAKFYNYWTELNQAGTKQRWEMQESFEVIKRLANWFSNYQKFKPKDEEKRGVRIS